MKTVTIGTPLTPVAKKALLCGSGELGKEVTIELQRYGVEVVAVDRYPNAPAMQVAHRSHVFSMLDGEKLRSVIEEEKPDIIIPEVEAIATPTLIELEKEGFTVIPTAKAAFLTMNREGIRRLAAEELGLPTSFYRFADTKEDFIAAVEEVGIPCVYEFFRPRTECHQKQRGYPPKLVHRPGRRTCRRRPCNRGEVCGFRL